MNLKWLPNFLTSTRILLVPVFLYCLFADFSHGKLLALIVFILASVTDAYDGILARKYNNVSKIGTFLDPLADKFLVLSAFYGFMFLPILSTTVKLWMIILISFRDILVTVLRTLMEYKGVTMITSKLGKFKTSLQILTITFILIFLILNSYQVELPDVNAVSSTLYLLMVFTTAITFYTGLHYFYHNYKTLGNIFFNR
ncbi:MAG: CDP-diacylglycerol--glycerol-3-phosphate 3-phosphatidyltransferase [Candidatus Marinimicrobia bacterium]|jgi:CDP-diacylglycerol--glycerol-3-phosphate 3-phosphatidyltransferase|nr:CDP-diacylglycerol--glycerol-3-phosphate 3-phosphatidyltransferase [Candidatus Neomarinimicrobiota bacterium]MDP6936406.1 CDP-diacylglycerol--glycerol-3-phosphate 3-phosphatidyltransferase [Candidatus Neomarinimicrobiota bacterium]